MAGEVGRDYVMLFLDFWCAPDESTILGNLLGIRLLMLRPLKQIHDKSGKFIMLGCDPISLYVNLIYVVAII